MLDNELDGSGDRTSGAAAGDSSASARTIDAQLRLLRKLVDAAVKSLRDSSLAQ